MILVTRHRGAIDWLQKRGFVGEIVSHINADEIKGGETVVGVLPITLVKQLLDKGCIVYILQLPDVPRELRGVELTSGMMDRFGAKLFKITNLEWEEVEVR